MTRGDICVPAFFFLLLFLLIPSPSMGEGQVSELGQVSGAGKISGAVQVSGAGEISAVERFQQGNEYYRQGKYAEAAQQYLALIRQGYQDPSILYNLGNACFKKGELGRAILFYERANRLLPRDDDIRKNLAYANSLAVDRIEVKSSALLSFWGKIINFLTINELTLIFTGIYLILIVLGILIIRKKEAAVRKRLVQLLTPFLTLLILVGGIFFYRIYELKAGQCGVIVSKVVEVKSGPEDSLATLFSLHEGTTFSIHQQRGDWLQIMLKNGWIGWVQSNDIQKI